MFGPHQSQLLLHIHQKEEKKCETIYVSFSAFWFYRYLFLNLRLLTMANIAAPIMVMAMVVALTVMFAQMLTILESVFARCPATTLRLGMTGDVRTASGGTQVGVMVVHGVVAVAGATADIMAVAGVMAADTVVAMAVDTAADMVAVTVVAMAGITKRSYTR